jgi:hypothetical protein
MAVMAFVTTAASIGLAALAIALHPDVRRSTPDGSDEFESGLRGWTTEPNTASVAGGRLQLHPTRPDSPALAIHALSAADFVAETRAQVVNGSTDNGYGIAVGGERSLTAFLISGDGYFSIMQQSEDGWRETQPWRPWPHVRRGSDSNILRLECRASACTGYVNEEVTARWETGARRQRLGLVAWRYTAESLRVEFEYLRVWARRR